jgi:glycosyltransferase involved in cell wall biosynthesis
LTLIRENARKMVAEVFNWETIIDRFDKLYES